MEEVKSIGTLLVEYGRDKAKIEVIERYVQSTNYIEKNVILNILGVSVAKNKKGES